MSATVLGHDRAVWLRRRSRNTCQTVLGRPQHSTTWLVQILSRKTYRLSSTGTIACGCRSQAAQAHCCESGLLRRPACRASDFSGSSCARCTAKYTLGDEDAVGRWEPPAVEVASLPFLKPNDSKRQAGPVSQLLFGSCPIY